MFAKVYSKKFLIYCGLLVPILGFFISAPPVQAALVNINTAGSEELQTLTGIGPSYAERIIEYRSINGSFQKIEDIKNVKGIGDVTFAKIKDFITVGSASIPAENEETDFPSENESGTATSEKTSSTPSFSTHYSSNELSSPPIKPGLEIGAGRTRLGVVGGPMEFKAETDLTYTKTTSFRWNFGDGATGEGLVASHTYGFPGEYVVILNVLSNEGTGTSRTDVKIIEPDLLVSFVSLERVEISNVSNSEVNLYGRAMVSGDIIFAFPKDTIIKSKQKISFDSKITSLRPSTNQSVALILVGESGLNKIELEKAKKNFFIQVAQMQKQIQEIKEQIKRVASDNTSSSKEDNLDLQVENQTTSNQNQTATVISAIPEQGKTTGLLGLIKKFFLGIKQ